MKKEKTVYPGVRCRLHPSRKHGINADRYFFIRYRLDGKTVEEGLGWASKGMTAKKASVYLSKLREAHLTGVGPLTLRETRQAARAKREEELRETLTFGKFFLETYLPLAEEDKVFESIRREKSLFKIWIEPVMGAKELTKIGVLDCERLKKAMFDDGQSPRSICYSLAVARQVINRARTFNLFSGENPVGQVRKPSLDNRRHRFLSYREADRLLRELEGNDLHDMALLSLHCGLRAGEIFNLTWGDVDLELGTLFLRDTKNRRNRSSYMTGQVKDMLIERKKTDSEGYIFKSRDGKRVERVSNNFWKAIKKLGFNKGITDPRDKVVFHSLRHTFASWLVESGVSLYVVKELLGHACLSQTERYSHLSQGTLQAGVKKLELAIKENEPAEIVDIAKAKHQ